MITYVFMINNSVSVALKGGKADPLGYMDVFLSE